MVNTGGLESKCKDDKFYSYNYAIIKENGSK